MSKKIAFIQGNWHRDITDNCKDSFTKKIIELGYDQDSIDYSIVAGGLEIPLQAKKLIKTGNYQAIVASAFVVDGGIYRHEFVAQAILDGMMDVQLELEVPIISAVLTPHQFHEHESHISYFKEHMKSKGIEAAVACDMSVKNLDSIS